MLIRNEADPRLIRLADADNVLLLATGMSEGEDVWIGGTSVALGASLSLGHKVAAREIRAGETILKYNFPIGVATADIPLGAHVHVHNVRSDYTASYIIPEA